MKNKQKKNNKHHRNAKHLNKLFSFLVIHHASYISCSKFQIETVCCSTLIHWVYRIGKKNIPDSEKTPDEWSLIAKFHFSYFNASLIIQTFWVLWSEDLMILFQNLMLYPVLYSSFIVWCVRNCHVIIFTCSCVVVVVFYNSAIYYNLNTQYRIQFRKTQEIPTLKLAFTHTMIIKWVKQNSYYINKNAF